MTNGRDGGDGGMRPDRLDPNSLHPLSRKIPLVIAVVAGLTLIGAVRSPSASNQVPGLVGQISRGGNVRVPPGSYTTIRLEGIQPSGKATIDFAGATAEGIVVKQSSNLVIRNLRIVGNGGRSYGINITDSRHIAVEGADISSVHRGIIIGGSADVEVRDARMHHIISDGINVAQSKRVQLIGNECQQFNPTKATYDANGRRLKDGDHPDCIQAWSRPPAAPTSDILVERNRVIGDMQGIFFGNHVRNGVDDGGFDRVIVRGNYIRVAAPNGITLNSVRSATIIDNVVETIPGRFLPNRPDIPVRANLRFSGSEIMACGNRVSAVPKAPGQGKCKTN